MIFKLFFSKTYFLCFINKVAVIMCGATKFTVQETEILVKWFRKACEVIHESDAVDGETVRKVIGFCLHVSGIQNKKLPINSLKFYIFRSPNV